MFPHTPDPDRLARRTVRTAIRDAADLAVAFLTLEAYGLDDLRPARSTRTAPVHTGIPSDDAAAGPGAGRAIRAAVGSEATPTPRGMAAQPAVTAPHAHRHALRAAHRVRRPGSVRTPQQLCITPIDAASPSAPARPAAPSPSRRTAPQDSPH